MEVSLSLWSLDQGHLAAEVERYGDLVDSFHVDVMDGQFADYLLYGPLMVQTLRSLTTRPIVTHLMVREPVRWVSRFADAGADLIAVHPSACGDFAATVAAIRRAGSAAGAAVGLTEPGGVVVEHLAELAAVLVMGTEIGVKGRQFDETALRTVTGLVDARAGDAPKVFMDGGIRWASVPRMASAGADGVVAGSIVAAAPDPRVAVTEIRAL